MSVARRKLALGKQAETFSRELGLENLEPTAEYEIPSSRPKGLDAAKVVRELREGCLR